MKRKTLASTLGAVMVAFVMIVSVGDISAQSNEIPIDWLEGSTEDRLRFQELEKMKTPPALETDNWLNSPPLRLEELRGKVILLDFWAPWCGPCIASIPHANKLLDEYGDEGLVVVGVGTSDTWENVQGAVTRHGIKYPVAFDVGSKIANAYRVNGYPDYYLIDRQGRLRILDCANGFVEEAVKLLLSEGHPSR